MDDTRQKSENIDFTTLAKQIDSEVDPDLLKQLKEVETFNIFLKNDIFGNEELIPVGSCIDGSKVTVPGDSGDIDLLIVSNRILLKEHLFDYDNEYPAFLHIRVNKEHEKYFKTVKDPIEDVYLPTVVLKELQERLFFLSKVWLSSKTREGMSEDGEFFNVTRTSAVGKEQMKLCPDEHCSSEFRENPETLKFKLKRMEKFAKCAIGGITYLVNSTKETNDEDESSTFGTQNRPMSFEHDNTSLLEMLHKFLDIGEDKETDDRYSEKVSDIDGDNNIEAVDNGKCDAMQCKDLETGENKKDTPEMFCTDPLRGDVYKRKLSQDCTTEAKRCNSRSDSKLSQNFEYRIGIDSDSTTITETFPRGACMKKPTQQTQHGTANTGTSFSKLKSTDFVPAFKFEGWPRVAEEWVTRPRKWPSKVTLKMILESGCQVVAKRPFALYSKPIADDRDPYFRLSFALSEIILAQNMKEQQMLCWRVLKAYQKCFLETKPKCLTSYHWKNVVFWVSEDLDDSFWTDENVLVGVLKCLKYMECCLKNRNLPFYFVRKMNLFNGYDLTLLDRLEKQVEDIRREPFEFLKRFIEEPPNSERHVIDTDEVKALLSREAKAQSRDRMSEEMVQGFISNFPSFCKSGDQAETRFPQFHETTKHLLKTALSDAEGKSSCASEDAQSSSRLREIFLDGFEKITESMKKDDGSEVLNTLGDFFQSVSHDKEFINECDKNPDGDMKESIGNTFSSLSSVLTGMQEESDSSGNTSIFFASFHKLAMKMQDDFGSKHTHFDESDEKEDKEASEVLSTLFGAFPKFVKGLQKSAENDDEMFSFPDEIRKILNETSQKIKSVTGEEGKTEKKSEMDIDLD